MASRTRHALRFFDAPIKTTMRGKRLLEDSNTNKGSGFTEKERTDFQLVGLLPPQVNSLEEQVQRAYAQYRTHQTALGRNIFLTSLRDQNVVLYYRLIEDHLSEMFSIIYTPTEGEAIANYSQL